MIIKARFDGKVFVPLERLDLPAGTPLVITVLNKANKQAPKKKPPRKRPRKK